MKKIQILLFVISLYISFISCPKIVEAQSFDIFDNRDQFIVDVQNRIDNLSGIDDEIVDYQNIVDQITEISVMLLDMTDEQINQLDLSKYNQYKSYLDTYAEENWKSIVPNIPLNYIDDGSDNENLLHKRKLMLAPSAVETSYSSLAQGYCTPVKFQNPYGTCWAFAAVAAAETNYALKNNKQKIDLSELQLAWFATGNAFIPDSLFLVKDDGIFFPSGGSAARLNSGANQDIAMLTLVSGIGFSEESYMQYPKDSFNGSDLDTKDDDHCYHSDYLVTNVDIISMKESEKVKAAIKENGAVASSYCHYPSTSEEFLDYYGPKGDSYFYSTNDYGVNHAITIVGWDDNYSKDKFGYKDKPKPSTDGAWLVKNSWGNNFGDNGYFWISYEEGSMANSLAYTFSIDKIDASKEYDLYQYDGGQAPYRIDGSSNKISVANMYTAQRNEKITNIGVFTGNADVKCTIKIYEIPEGKNPYSNDLGDPLATKVYQAANAGYHLVKLDTPVEIQSGKNFAAVVDYSLSTSGKITIFVDKFAYLFNDRMSYDSQKSGQCYMKDGNAVYDLKDSKQCSNRIKVLCEKSTNVDQKPTYTVEHYVQSLNDELNYELKDSFTMEASALGESVTATEKIYAGFTYDDIKSSSTKTGVVNLDKSLVLKMYYSRNDVTLSFNTDGGTSIESITKKYESPITPPQNPTKSGFVFTGWDKDIPEKMPAEDTTFTAQWKAREQSSYDVEVYLQGIINPHGTNIEYVKSDTYSKTFNDNVYVGDSVSCDGSTISIPGFTYDPDQTKLFGKSSGLVTPSSSKLVLQLYYSRDKYSLSLLKGEGIKNIYGDGEYYFEQNIGLYVELEDGYQFKNYIDDVTKEEITTKMDYAYKMPSKNMTIKANGEPIEYPITYILNNGNNGSNPEKYTIKDEDIIIQNPTRDNYLFDGWIVNGDGEPIKDFVIEQGSIGEVELSAVWTSTKVDLSETGLNENDVIYIDGKKYTLNSNKEIVISDDNLKEATVYTYANSEETDGHLKYPTHLEVYFLERDPINEEMKLVHKPSFDDIMVYAGASIRMTGNKGIRIITSIPTDKKNNLINNEYSGYKVMEYGTLISWADVLNGEEPTLYLDADGTFKATQGAKGRAFSREAGINAVFSEGGGFTKYTNTLVESSTNPWTDKYSNDFAMRSYIIICPKDSTDTDDYIVIYGGTLYRSISYVAYQNKDTYSPGTAAYEYIHGLIEAGNIDE